MKTVEQIEDEIDDLLCKIATEEYWLEQTCNPMKLRRRVQQIKRLRKQIAELKSKLTP